MDKLISLLQTELVRRKENQKKYDWQKNARQNQLMPEGDWKIWLILAGRGFGKTRTGAETIRQLISKGYKRVCLLGDTELDVLNVMLRGESGLLSICPEAERPLVQASQRMVKWKNGASGMMISATAYEQLRGPQFDCAWVDELAKFPDPKAAFEQLLLALRLKAFKGQTPKMIITTTPKSMPFLKELMARKDVVITYGSTFDNKDNLSSAYLDAVEETFSNSKFGQQELYGKIVDYSEQAFCSNEMISVEEFSAKDCVRVVVAVDPAAGNSRDETGIVVCGELTDGRFLILEDASARMSPAQWSSRAVELYKFYDADCIVAEVNQGGDMVETLIRQVDDNVLYEKVYATRGKMIRAQPIAALYERKKMIHADHFQELEEQMLADSHSHSPDRLDALVWGITYLLKNNKTSKNSLLMCV